MKNHPTTPSVPSRISAAPGGARLWWVATTPQGDWIYYEASTWLLARVGADAGLHAQCDYEFRPRLAVDPREITVPPPGIYLLLWGSTVTSWRLQRCRWSPDDGCHLIRSTRSPHAQTPPKKPRRRRR